MNLIKKIFASCVLAGILLCSFNLNVFATAEREVDINYQTCYVAGAIVYITEQENTYSVKSLGGTIEWEAQKTNDKMITDSNVFARKNPNIQNKDELILQEGTSVTRVGISDNGWDIIEYNDELYFIWYDYIVPDTIVKEIEGGILEDNNIKDLEDVIEEEEEQQTGSYVGTFELTAYCATGNPCADGVYPSTGYTAACNDSRLWHHWILIEGYGTYYVHDTGGMASNVVDIFMGSYNECIQFGRRSANVYILD